MTQHCCERMNQHLTDGEGAAVIYVAKFHEYGIPVLDGPRGTAGPSYITLDFCPWCGTKLPENTRESYFENLSEIN